MRNHATLTALIAGLLLGAPTTATAAEQFLFPVVGGATYTDDYGDPRPQGRHQGNDLLAPKGTPVIAVQDGVVKLHHSGRAGYMLYLRSATKEWVYIHLNNDRRGNDGRGGRRTAYAKGLKSGMRVRAGQEIAYVGNSGDAEGGPSHLHFEERTPGGRARNPYRRLRRAPIVYLSAPASAKEDPGPLLSGRVAWVAEGDDGLRLALRSSSLRDGRRTFRLRRMIVVRVAGAIAAEAAALAPGAPVVVETAPAPMTRSRQLLRPGVWTASSITPR